MSLERPNTFFWIFHKLVCIHLPILLEGSNYALINSKKIQGEY